MTRIELHEFFIDRGWANKANGRIYYKEGHADLRYKINRLVLRKERRTSLRQWVRVASGYISKLSVNGEGKLSGLVR